MGTVYLVGAGPGDPGLLTVRGREVLGKADVVFYDALANERLLRETPEGARCVCVGKRAGRKRFSQPEIHELLTEAARRRDVVVRLKGGDPFVFGRGGEEASALREAGVSFEVVPGVTSGIGALSYAGIPVTHRGLASGVTFVTGHEDPEKDRRSVDWRHVARAGGTLVVFMGMRRVPEIADRLVREGRAPGEPAAAVEWGTYPRQRVVDGTLRDIAGKVRREGLGSPGLLVVGDVVRLRRRLDWLGDRPLLGRRVVVARARAQPSRIAARLREAGARVEEHPAVRPQPPEEPGRWRRAVAGLGEADVLVLTSATAVEALWDELGRRGRDARALAGIRIAAVGVLTRRALEERGVLPDLVPSTYRPGAVADELESAASVRGARVVIPLAAGAASPIADTVAERGADVQRPTAFRLVSEAADETGLEEAFAGGAIDAVVFGSSSSVRSFAAELGPETGDALVAAIGSSTADTARHLGFPVDAVPEASSVEGLAEALARRFSPGPASKETMAV